jgi:hypothetical protein
MTRWRRLSLWSRNWAAVVALAPALAGCILNNVDEIQSDDGFAPSRGRAVLVFGLGALEEHGLTVILEEYDPQRAQVTGNGWHWNRAQASVVRGAPGQVRYFAFSVEPGYYAWSGFNNAELASADGLEAPLPSIAFRAPADRVTYVGDFYPRSEIRRYPG